MTDSIRETDSGKRQEFSALIDQNEQVMLRVATRLCNGNSDRAQDLVQDALIRAYRAFVEGKLRWSDNVRGWLIRILTNVFLNDYERQKRQGNLMELDALDADVRESVESAGTFAAPRPDEILLSASLDEPLEKALGALSDEFRACVILVDVEGLEYADAAAALGIPIGTVRSRLARARLQLHALLYDYASDLRRV